MGPTSNAVAQDGVEASQDSMPPATNDKTPAAEHPKKKQKRAKVCSMLMFRAPHFFCLTPVA